MFSVYQEFQIIALPLTYVTIQEGRKSSPLIPDSPSFTYVSSPTPAALHGTEVEGVLTSVHVSTARHTTVLSSLHTYVVMLLWSSCLRESGAAPYSDTPTALCGSVSGEH